MSLAVLIESCGLALDPREAGYVLPDGRMLDFSGRNQASGYRFNPTCARYVTCGLNGQDWLSGQRALDHRDWPERVCALYGALSGDELMLKLMREFNLARVDFTCGVASFVAPLTTAQIQAIACHAATLPDRPWVLGHCRADNGDEIASQEWESAPSPLLVQRFAARNVVSEPPASRRRFTGP